MPRDIGVIVVAAGQGLRLGGEAPKQFQLIDGVPMLLRALRPFTSHPEVVQVVVVVPASEEAAPPPWLAGLIGGTLSVVAGGVERSDSVAAGLGALVPECRLVLVHDAARPFVDRQTIDAVISAARQGGSAVPAIAVGDTLKETTADDQGNRVERTVPRERLWRAQTPQGFPRGILERAYEAARRDGVTATDDATLVERLGERVVLVPGSSRNLKVTSPDDLLLAELLARRLG